MAGAHAQDGSDAQDESGATAQAVNDGTPSAQTGESARPGDEPPTQGSSQAAQAAGLDASVTESEGAVLAFFAHPDDETLGAGIQIAHLARNNMVYLVTATRGEMGEVATGTLKNPTPEALAERRSRELKLAATRLGVARVRFLDRFLPEGTQSVRPTDSGMQWADETHSHAVADPAADAESAFSLGDLEIQAKGLARAIDHYRPRLLITEEPGGGYGHPDHVRCHQVASRALELAHHRVEFVTYAVKSRSAAESAQSEVLANPRALAATVDGRPVHAPEMSGPMASSVWPDDQVDVEVDTDLVRSRVVGAMRAHRTQIPVVGSHRERTWYTLTDGYLKGLPPRAGFALAPGQDASASALDRFVNVSTPAYPAWFRHTMFVFMLFLGALTAALGTVFHRAYSPWGLVVALGAVVLMSVLARTLAEGRGVGGYWVVLVTSLVALTYLGRGADVLIAGDMPSVIWLLGAILLGLSGAFVPRGWLRE